MRLRAAATAIRFLGEVLNIQAATAS